MGNSGDGCGRLVGRRQGALVSLSGPDRIDDCLGYRAATFSLPFVLFGPVAGTSRVTSTLQGTSQRYEGHLPGLVWIIVAMHGLIIVWAVTDIALGQGFQPEIHLHDLLAYALAAILATHVLGAALYSVCQRGNITPSLIHRDKQVSAGAATPAVRPLVAVALVTLLDGWPAGLAANDQPLAQRPDFLPGEAASWRKIAFPFQASS